MALPICIVENENMKSILTNKNCNNKCHQDAPCPVENIYRCESGDVSVAWLGSFKHNDT